MQRTSCGERSQACSHPPLAMTNRRWRAIRIGFLARANVLTPPRSMMCPSPRRSNQAHRTLVFDGVHSFSLGYQALPLSEERDEDPQRARCAVTVPLFPTAVRQQSSTHMAMSSAHYQSLQADDPELDPTQPRSQSTFSHLVSSTTYPPYLPPAHRHSRSKRWRLCPSALVPAILSSRPALRWLALPLVLAIAGCVVFASSIETFFSIISPSSVGFGVGSGNGLGKPKGGVMEVPIPGVKQDGTVSSAERLFWVGRKDQVRGSFLFAWNGYLKKAFPMDELKPASGRGNNKFNGWSVTLADSLTTLWILNLKPQFYDAVKRIERLDFMQNSNANGYVPFFETVIRYLGGYLGAYALVGESSGGSVEASKAQQILLAHSTRLASLLIPIFEHGTAEKKGIKGVPGLPAFSVDFNSKNTILDGGGGGAPDVAVLAELGSCQLEYKYLARLTGKEEFYAKVESVSQHLYNASTYKDLFADRWSLTTGEPVGKKYTVGAGVDSTYEYFLKQYLMMGDRAALKQYLKSITSILHNLLFLSPIRGLLYVTDLPPDSVEPLPTHKHEHLSCFLPGLIALGAHTLPSLLANEELSHLRDLAKALVGESSYYQMTAGAGVGSDFEATMNGMSKEELLEVIYPQKMKQRHEWAAEGLAYTCWVMYADSTSGLGSDKASFKLARAPVAGDKNHGGTGEVVKQRRWVDALGEWETRWKEGDELAAGRKPPGTREPPPEKNEGKRDYINTWPEEWLMRPETVESIYILWKTTGDRAWRERGYAIYSAIEKYAKTNFGYSSVGYVDTPKPAITDDMPSYFLAETLKYLYLLFDDEDIISFDKWVFNTEAHPLPVFKWTATERRKFGIDL